MSFSIFGIGKGKISNEFCGEPVKTVVSGEKLYSFEYIADTKQKRYSVSGTIHTRHAEERVKKIYDKLRSAINSGHVKPIDLQRAIEKALKSEKDLRDKNISIKVKKSK